MRISSNLRLLVQEWLQGGEVPECRRRPIRVLPGFLQETGRRCDFGELSQAGFAQTQVEAERGVEVVIILSLHVVIR